MPDTPSSDVRRRAGWLPADQDDLEDWLEGRRSDAADGPLHPAVQAFRDLIEGDAVLRMHANEMIEQVPRGRRYRQRHLADLDELLHLISEVLHAVPEFSTDGSVATPLGALLDWTTATRAGFAFYRDPRVNAALRGVLDAWSEFLSSPASLAALHDGPGGWTTDAAQRAIGIEQFRHDPADPHWGFTSWNDFFTRRFVDGARPVADPDDDRAIVAACEATPHRIATGVRRQDEFWAKREAYSLREMLADDAEADRFVGGTVFQAFLSALNYHRWHSPVAGTVAAARVVAGTYYSEADAQGQDAVEPTVSQGYLAHVATRAIILIDADDAAIGRVAVIPIGMEDVSSCLLADGIAPGRHVEKGEELGRFQYGGSTHCLVFEPGVVESFAVGAIPPQNGGQAAPVPVRSRLATARRR